MSSLQLADNFLCKDFAFKSIFHEFFVSVQARLKLA